MSEINTGSVSPEGALALANAMALRVGQSDTLAERIFAGLTDAPYETKSSEGLRQTHRGRTALYLAKVESPEARISWKEIVNATCGKRRS